MTVWLSGAIGYMMVGAFITGYDAGQCGEKIRPYEFWMGWFIWPMALAFIWGDAFGKVLGSSSDNGEKS